MTYYNTPMYTVPAQYQQTRLPMGAVTTMGIVGAVLGGISAAARGIRASQAKDVNRTQIVGEVLKESVGAGLAVAAGTAAAGAISRNSAVSFAAMAVVGIGTKYLYDGLVSSGKSTKTNS